MKLLLICSGNTCRSPMAEALGTFRYPEHEFRSRGLNVDRGSTVSEHSLTAVGKAGHLIADHVPTQLVETDFEWADTVFAMTESQVQASKQLLGASISRLAEHIDIEDPFGGELAMYQRTADRILSALIDRLGFTEF